MSSPAVPPARHVPARARRPALLLAVVLMATLLAACEATVALDVTVDADGSGQVAVRLATDAAAAAAVDEAVADAGATSDVDVAHPFDAFVSTVEGLDGWEVSDTRDDDGARTLAATTDVDDADELEAVTADLAAALDGAEGRLLGPVRLHVDEETVRLDAELAAVVDVPAALGVAGDEVQLRARGDGSGAPRDLDDLLAGDPPLSVRLGAEMPGAVADTDADVVDGRQLVWHAEPGAVREVHAVASRSVPPTQRPWLLAAGGAVLLIATAVGVLAVRRLRR